MRADDQRKARRRPRARRARRRARAAHAGQRGGEPGQQRIGEVGQDRDRHLHRLDRLEQEEDVAGEQHADDEREVALAGVSGFGRAPTNSQATNSGTPISPRNSVMVSASASALSVTLVATSAKAKADAATIAGMSEVRWLAGRQAARSSTRHDRTAPSPVVHALAFVHAIGDVALPSPHAARERETTMAKKGAGEESEEGQEDDAPQLQGHQALRCARQVRKVEGHPDLQARALRGPAQEGHQSDAPAA